MKKLSFAISVLLTGCAATPVYPPRVYVRPPAEVVYLAPAPQPVVSVYVEPPMYQPPPIRVQWAPPPMLVETVPYRPYPDAIWTGGYWVWQGNWVWAHGRWAAPPQPGYGWVNPYYENRGGSVLFVNGFWAAPGVSFVPPAPNINIAVAQVTMGVAIGLRPVGPEGVFVPAPPGSRLGLIIPAPIGTAPAVVVSAPPVVNEGMQIHVNSNSNNTYNNNSVTNNAISNNNVTNNLTNIRNVTNVTIVAPASATASGQSVNFSVPAQAHLAASLPPVVRVAAPEPISAKAIQSYVAGHPSAALPPPQMVHAEMAQVHQHPPNQGHAAAPVQPVVPNKAAAPVAALPHPLTPDNEASHEHGITRPVSMAQPQSLPNPLPVPGSGNPVTSPQLFGAQPAPDRPKPPAARNPPASRPSNPVAVDNREKMSPTSRRGAERKPIHGAKPGDATKSNKNYATADAHPQQSYS
ncbi:hypothetical protein RCH09_003820 [Actimicrobium sp. GrIS 1.19]|uniref:hypothetical protein n=1 Tax=Actimicrobium sp. GrIS 1.19 TaxID=3071708 RepID=UPI002E0BFE04|nr:hypothetical protein [Actimicrobium sp. GrIS 1.19]